MNISSAKSRVVPAVARVRTEDQPLTQQVTHLFLAMGLGALGGTTGVALAFALVIMVQLALPPATLLPSTVIPITVAGALFGIGVAWLVNGAVQRLRPGLVQLATERSLQIVLIFSVLTSLLQGFLFTQGL